MFERDCKFTSLQDVDTNVFTYECSCAGNWITYLDDQWLGEIQSRERVTFGLEQFTLYFFELGDATESIMSIDSL